MGLFLAFLVFAVVVLGLAIGFAVKKNGRLSHEFDVAPRKSTSFPNHEGPLGTQV